MLPVEIGFSVRHAEASLVGQPILLYNPRHEGAKQYYALTEVIYDKTR